MFKATYLQLLLMLLKLVRAIITPARKNQWRWNIHVRYHHVCRAAAELFPRITTLNYRLTRYSLCWLLGHSGHGETVKYVGGYSHYCPRCKLSFTENGVFETWHPSGWKKIEDPDDT